MIFDRYLPDSVKNATRSKRRRNKIGINKQIANRCTALPSDLDTFYTIQSNKENLERFLTDEFLGWSDVLPRVELVTSGGFQDATKAASSIGRNVTTLYSNHEEADTRILLHGKDAARCDFYRTVVFSVDTDVLVLLLHHHEFLTNEIWIQHGALSNSTFIPVHEIAAVTEAAVLQNLPAFHAITGCDSTSQLRYHTKISSWTVFLEKPTLLEDLGMENAPSEKTEMSVEKFVVSLYNRKLSADQRTNCETADAMRFYMLLKLKNLQRLPPTSENVRLHILRLVKTKYMRRKCS